MIYIGSDHAGYGLKERIKRLFDERGLQYEDVGAYSDASTDYPTYAFAVAEKVGASSLAGGEDIGVLACGSGVGMAIASNKVKGVRAALATTEYMGRQSREHDNANVLVLAGRVMDEPTAVKVAEAFLDASFSTDERHRRRVKMITDYEEKHLS